MYGVIRIADEMSDRQLSLLKEIAKMLQQTDFPHGHAPRTDLGHAITQELQRVGVANLDLRNTVELILAVVALKEVLSQ